MEQTGVGYVDWTRPDQAGLYGLDHSGLDSTGLDSMHWTGPQQSRQSGTDRNPIEQNELGSSERNWSVTKTGGNVCVCVFSGLLNHTADVATCDHWFLFLTISVRCDVHVTHAEFSVHQSKHQYDDITTV